MAVPLRALAIPLLMTVAVLASGCTSAPDDTPPGVTHAPDDTAAPAFALTTIDGDNVTLEGLRGKVVLLEFMGLGCTSCRANLPAHKEIWETYGDDDRFVFLAVNVWSVWCGDEGCGSTGESVEDMRAYRDAEGIGWPMMQATTPMPGEYNVRGTPTQFFIDHEGNVHSVGGRMTYDAMVTEIEHMLDDLA